MKTEQQIQTEKLLSNFLSQHTAEIPDFTNLPLESTGLAEHFKNYPLKLTHFEDLYDTLMYSGLIGKALEMSPGVRTIIDFGAGSSIPSLLAVKEGQKTDVDILAVDIDPEAEHVGVANAELLGLREKYSFRLSSMQDVLKSEIVDRPSLLIVSNPPYVATPEELTQREFVPVNGGEDGSRYMQDLLNREYPDGTVLALLWGSLTNPQKIIPLIEEKFEIFHLDAMKIHFGKYTQNPAIKSHLYKLREQGLVAFENEEGEETQTVIGTILRPKKKLQ